MSHRPCSVTARQSGRTAFIIVDGCLDCNAPNPEKVIRDAVQPQTKFAILDLSRTPMLNSEGLDWLDEIRSKLEPKGVRLRVVAPAGSKVHRILQLMRYDKVATVLYSLAEAFRAGKRRTMRLLRARKQDTVTEKKRARSITGQG